MSIDQTPAAEIESDISPKVAPESADLAPNGAAVQPSSVEAKDESTDDSTPAKAQADEPSDDSTPAKAEECESFSDSAPAQGEAVESTDDSSPAKAEAGQDADGATPGQGEAGQVNDDSNTVQGEAGEATDELKSSEAEEKPTSSDTGTSEKHDQRFQELASAFLAAHRQEVSQRDGEIHRLKTELMSVQNANAALLEQAPRAEIEGLLTHLSSSVFLADDHDQISKSLEQIWASIFAAVNSAMHCDIADECSTAWQQENLCSLLGERVNSTAVVAPLLANPTSATEGRVIVVMAILAQLLEEYIFTPEYLLEDDDDLRDLLRASKNPLIKQGLRSMLLLASDVDDWKRTVIKKRISNALDELIDLVKTLLPHEMSTVLRNNLELELETVAGIWEHAQRSQSHFEVNTNPGSSRWSWKSISSITQGLNLIDIDSSDFDPGERVMVVFPRVFALDRSNNPSFTPVFSGIILQESRVKDLQAEESAKPADSEDAPVVSTDTAPVEGEETNAEAKVEGVGESGDAGENDPAPACT